MPKSSLSTRRKAIGGIARFVATRCIALIAATTALLSALGLRAGEPVRIDGHRELFVDDYLIDKQSGTTLELQQPREREIVFVHDAPWEGSTSTYHTIIKDGDIYRMYYRGGGWDEANKKSNHAETFCYAESKDGIHWTRPDLGIVEFEGSKKNNNIIISGTARITCLRFSTPTRTANRARNIRLSAAQRAGSLHSNPPMASISTTSPMAR